MRAMTMLAVMLPGFPAMGVAGCLKPSPADSRRLAYAGSVLLSEELLISGPTVRVDHATLPIGLPGFGSHVRPAPRTGVCLALIGPGGADVSVCGYRQKPHAEHFCQSPNGKRSK
jgi:hypothetical protein